MDKIRLGVVRNVENKGKKFGASLDYLVVWVKDCNETVPLALTTEEIARLKLRARINPEDIPELISSEDTPKRKRCFLWKLFNKNG